MGDDNRGNAKRWIATPGMSDIKISATGDHRADLGPSGLKELSAGGRNLKVSESEKRTSDIATTEIPAKEPRHAIDWTLDKTIERHTNVKKDFSHISASFRKSLHRLALQAQAAFSR